MQIRTNNVPRDVIEAYELSSDERKEFDYINWDKIEAGEDSASFFRHKGTLYDLGEFMVSEMFPNWDGYISDTFFSGMLVRYCNDFEQVIVGSYCT